MSTSFWPQTFCDWNTSLKYASLQERFPSSASLRFESWLSLHVGVVGILGSTYTGEYEDIAGMDKVVSELNKKNGWNVGIHVDAASGGFIAPFVRPELKWDFQLENVVSINVSGHK